MFAEVGFGSDGDEDSVEPSRTPANTPLPHNQTTTLLRVHQPGDAEFSIVAGATTDMDARFNTQMMSGDGWTSHTCHCLRCEGIMMVDRLRRFSNTNTTTNNNTTTNTNNNNNTTNTNNNIQPPQVLVLLDLDNFGFNQFKSVVPGCASKANMVLQHVVVWAFFGSCFTRHHNVWPSEDVLCANLPRRAQQQHINEERPTIWQQLVRDERVQLTPCGGHKQAADDVMMQVLASNLHQPMMLITGDAKMVAELRHRRRTPGRKSRRTNEMDMMGEQLTIINVLDHEKRFVPVWMAMEQAVKQFLDQGA